MRFNQLLERLSTQDFELFDHDGGRLNSLVQSLAKHDFEQHIPKLAAKGVPLHPVWATITDYRVDPAEMLEKSKALLSMGAHPDGNGNGDPLRWVAEAPEQLPVLRLLLEAGANPMLKGQDAATAMSLALQRNPEGVVLLREYAQPYLAKKRGAALHTRKRSPAYELPQVTGAADFLKPLEPVDYQCRVILVRAAPEVDVASEIAALTAGRVERDFRKRLAEDRDWTWWVLRIEGYEWTIVLHDVGRLIGPAVLALYPFIDGYVPKLSAMPGVEVVLDLSCGGLSEWQQGEVTMSTSKLVEPMSIEELKQAVAEGRPLFETQKPLWQEQREEQEQVERTFRERHVFLPLIDPEDDGYHSTITIWGVKKSQVLQLDRIVWRPPSRDTQAVVEGKSGS
ncbi:MAG: hypothetical protein GXP55_09655 [Deltaproteobacteria bacterium]|nr:hypothetical protein [Deltaproteobacteria bacterium]